MSVLDEINELDKQRHALVQVAKLELYDAAKTAVAELNKVGKELGFRYTLSESKTEPTSKTRTLAPTGKRLSAHGIEDLMELILGFIAASGDGMTARQIYDQMNVSKKSEQSYSGYIRKLVDQGKVSKITTKSDGSNLAKKDIRYKAV